MAGWDYAAGGTDWNEMGYCTYAPAAAQQSPIDVPLYASADPDNNEVVLRYPILKFPTVLYATDQSLALTVPDNYKAGFGITTKDADAQQVKVLMRPGAAAYRLWQMEFHSPSEHTLSGHRYPLELQLSHKRSDDDSVAVMSVFFEPGEGARSVFLDTLIGKGLPSSHWEESELSLGQGLNLEDLLGGSMFFEYEGSLTTPPCEIGVRWLIKKDPVLGSMKQILTFVNALTKLSPPKGNARLIPRGTEAGSNVIILPASNIKAEAIKASAAEDAEEAKIRAIAGSLSDNPKFKKLNPEDSAGLKAAKEQYREAALDDTAARTSKAEASRKLRMAKDMFDKQAGLVGKIDYKWQIIQAKNDYEGAVLWAEKAAAALAKKSQAGAKALMKEDASPKSKEESEAADDPNGRMMLKFAPRVYLPNGFVGNPFRDDLAESVIKPGPDRSRLANNLKQQASTLANAPIPQLMPWKEEPPPGPTLPPPAEVVIKVSAPADEVSNAKLFGQDITAALVDGVDGQTDRVELAEARRVALLTAKQRGLRYHTRQLRAGV